MKLYTIPHCPFVQRVDIGLNLRQIGRDIVTPVSIDIAKPPLSLVAINPTGSVPTLEFADGSGFHESLIINEFLDTIDQAVGPKLYGDSPFQTAKIKIQVETLNAQVGGVLQKVLYSRGNEMAHRSAVAALPKAFALLNEALNKSGGTYLGGDTLNASDASLAPFLELYETARTHLRLDLPAPEPKRVAGYLIALLAHPAVRPTLSSTPELTDALKPFMTPDPLILAVKKASRNLLENPVESIEKLNAHLATTARGSKTNALSSPLWSLGKTPRGPIMMAHFEFCDRPTALAAAGFICETEETTDHHANTQQEDFKRLKISICTHEPHWGITQKDIALARVLSETLLAM